MGKGTREDILGIVGVNEGSVRGEKDGKRGGGATGERMEWRMENEDGK